MIILLPPSEGKQSGGDYHTPSAHQTNNLPLDIATTATEKDLKCTGKRYEEGISLNQSIHQGPRMPAIDRYDGVMYRAIDYPGLSENGKVFFDTHVRILSGLYGLVAPQEMIANYKLPVTTRLKHFWKEKLTTYINILESNLIVDLLPGAYREMIDRKHIDAHVVQVERRQPDGKKISHGVKGIKGRWLHNLCLSEGNGYDRSGDILTFTP